MTSSVGLSSSAAESVRSVLAEADATAAVLIPLIPAQDGWNVLYEVRSGRIRQPGEICFPGGRTEPGENPADTAVRESCEELGLRPCDIALCRAFTMDTLAGSGRRVQPVAGVLEPAALERLSLSADEVAEVFTVPVNWLLHTPARRYTHCPGSPSPNIPPVLQSFLQHYSRALHTLYWEYNRHGIWGMTARITQTLVNCWPLDELERKETGSGT